MESSNKVITIAIHLSEEVLSARKERHSFYSLLISCVIWCPQSHLNLATFGWVIGESRGGILFIPRKTNLCRWNVVGDNYELASLNSRWWIVIKEINHRHLEAYPQQLLLNPWRLTFLPDLPLDNYYPHVHLPMQVFSFSAATLSFQLVADLHSTDNRRRILLKVHRVERDEEDVWTGQLHSLQCQ